MNARSDFTTGNHRIDGWTRKPVLFVIDDHPIFREGFRKLVEQEIDLHVSGEAGAAREALDKLKTLRADLIIVDVSLGDMDGLDLVAKLKKQHPACSILVLSMHADESTAARARRAGADGYMTKDAPPDALLRTIAEILSRPQGASRPDVSGSGDPCRATSDIDRLSTREIEIARLIGRGLATREIAERIGIHRKTVETHRGNIRRKLGIGTGKDLRFFAEKTFSAHKADSSGSARS